jgi:hypothetical protein
MTNEPIPESREVWEHGNRVFDRRDALYGLAERIVFGVAAGLLLALAVLLW